VRWQKFSSFGFAKGWLMSRAKPNVQNVWLEKKKLKMRVGKNFKYIRVGLSVGSLVCVNLLKNCPC
jgi:hypothetical protein